MQSDQWIEKIKERIKIMQGATDPDKNQLELGYWAALKELKEYIDELEISGV